MAWYEQDHYTNEEGLAHQIATDDTLHGPQGVALVRVFSEGRTTSGWGLQPLPETVTKAARPGFMVDYLGDRFAPRVPLGRFRVHQEPFAIVMRSVNLLCLDVDRHLGDGGADGFIGIKELGQLPPTLAETSKSGEGRHLFYRTPDGWDETVGFSMYEDAIGLAPGVDMRINGCVYHYASQRWNDRIIADAPDHLLARLDKKRARKTATTTMLAAAAAGDIDDLDVIIVHDGLLQELNKPVKPGKRNITMYAIGQKMKAADYPNWQEEIRRRSEEIGLDVGEDEKIITNIERNYA